MNRQLFVKIFGFSTLFLNLGCHSSKPPSPPSPVPFEAASTLTERANSVAVKKRPAALKNVENGAYKKENQEKKSERAEALSQGISFLEQGNFVEAHRRALELWNTLDTQRNLSLDDSLAESPYRDAALLLGITEAAQGEKDKGVQILERLLRNNSTWESPYLALAQAYSDRKAHGLAARVARTGLDRIEGASGTLHATLARELRHMEKSNEAIAIVERGLGQFPNDIDLLVWRGILEDDAGRHTAACEHFALAYARLPGNVVTAHNRALCLTRQGDWDGAMVVLRLSIAQHPRSPALRFLAGYVYFKQGNFTAARKTWSDFLSLTPSDDPRRLVVQVRLESSGDEVGNDPGRPITP